MSDGDRYSEARRQGFRCALSLAKAIDEAGGSVSSVMARLMENPDLSLEEFISRTVAQNNIEFVAVQGQIEFAYVPPATAGDTGELETTEGK